MSADIGVEDGAGTGGEVVAEVVGVTVESGRRGRRRTWVWRTSTAPFGSLPPTDGQAAFVVEQIGDSTFRIPEGAGFRYTPPEGEPVLVDATTLQSTDFASIPRYMSWFVSRHGRHTPAALVHDRLVVGDMSLEERIAADAVFLAMLDDLAVPPVQSRVMWAAVTAATRMRCSARSRAGIIAWGVPAALLWGRQRAAGVIAGYAVPVVVVPAAASLAGYWCYWLVETAVKLVRRL